MTKDDLANSILSSLGSEDWTVLEDPTSGIPVSAHNRQILLRLRKSDADFDEETDPCRVETARTALEAFLNRTWAEEPSAHKYVVLASLAQAFIFEKPMHSWKAVRYFTSVENGSFHYYCPAKEADSVCDFCPAEPADRFRPALEEKCRNTLESFGKESAEIQKLIFESGFSDSGVMPVEKLRFFDEVRKICEGNQCRRYGTTWACPPAVGTLDECRERVSDYRYFQLFAKAYRLTDPLDLEGVKDALADFKEAVGELDHKLRFRPEKLLVLSNESCDLCKKCTYPDSPCRFPDKMHHSIESYGFYVSELALQAGIKYNNGSSSVTFFGAVLY